MKAGNHAAKAKVISSQCGFEKSLPKVCCPRNSVVGENIKTTTKPPNFEAKPAPAALLQTAKHSSNSLIKRLKKTQSNDQLVKTI